jgi:hypothetical protein
MLAQLNARPLLTMWSFYVYPTVDLSTRLGIIST